MARETCTVTVTATDPDGKVLPRVTVVVMTDGNTCEMVGGSKYGSPHD